MVWMFGMPDGGKLWWIPVSLLSLFTYVTRHRHISDGKIWRTTSDSPNSSKFSSAKYTHYTIFCCLWHESVHGENDYQFIIILVLISSSCIDKSQHKNTHVSLNMKPSWLTWIKTLCLVIILMDDAIMYTWFRLLAWHNKYKLLQFINTSSVLSHLFADQ